MEAVRWSDENTNPSWCLSGPSLRVRPCGCSRQCRWSWKKQHMELAKRGPGGSLRVLTQYGTGSARRQQGRRRNSSARYVWTWSLAIWSGVVQDGRSAGLTGPRGPPSASGHPAPGLMGAAAFRPSSTCGLVAVRQSQTMAQKVRVKRETSHHGQRARESLYELQTCGGGGSASARIPSRAQPWKLQDPTGWRPEQEVPWYERAGNASVRQSST
jgi:hypothetical protein